MKVALIGPELEENLGLRYLHSSIERCGHNAEIFDFHDAKQTQTLVKDIIRYKPEVAGLSMVFTGRAGEFLELARQLRQAGFNGHITAGGHFASFHAEKLLTSFPAIDSIVHGEGEHTIADLLEHLDRLHAVSGVSYRNKSGGIEKSAPRPNPEDLDTLPFPTRPAHFHTYLGFPIANILGSRGCYGKCHYCSITAWYRQNLGRRFRQRSVQQIAREMRELYHDRGVRIFNFHDDNFFLPNTLDTVDRFTALRNCLDEQGLGRIAIQVKARPDSVRPETIAPLKEMGLFRVFLGIESNSSAALKTLGRNIPRSRNHAALKILQNYDIHVTFNLLMFDPETTLADLQDNIDFMRQYAHMPLNFGRTEVYSGTPLEKILRSQNRLLGNFLGYHYIISNQEAQRVFELYRRVFLPRNFDADGMNLQAMKLDYYYHLLRHFYPDRAKPSLHSKVKALISRLNNNSAVMLSDICDFAAGAKSKDTNALETFARKLARSQNKCDTKLNIQTHALLNRINEMARCSKTTAAPRSAVAASAAAAVLIMTVVGCDGPGKEERPPNEPNEIVAPQPQLRQLSEEEVATVQFLIHRNYHEPLHMLLGRHNLLLSNLKVTIDLQIDSAGKVSANNISMSKGGENKAFIRELAEQIGTWAFPKIEESGRCRVVLDYLQKVPEGWHMCEMMMRPIEPEGQKNTDTQ